jgi:selenocysteine-specific elongation factor
MHVVATAGHVDHGKSTLVRALTGMEPDRWAEERRRGLTIDLGFAWTTLPAGERVAFVDVPGHERFVPNMLAGLGPVPAVLVVVAADEGWRPQSAEHLAAIDALGVRHGLLVVTRSDLADPAAAAAEARERLGGTSLGAVGAVAVSGVTGAGLDDLRAALARLVRGLPAPDPAARVRLWVDRAFTVRGAGTVVTGTLPAGTVRVGDELELAPAGRAVRVRGLQALGEAADRVEGVARVAVNLRGVDRHELRRGDALLTPGAWLATEQADVRLHGTADLKPSAHLVLHVGSAAVPARVRPFPGGTARLRLADPLPLSVGDRGLLRDPSRHDLVVGVTVLDPLPHRLSRRGDAARRAQVLEGVDGRPDAAAELRRRGLVTATQLRQLGAAAPPSATRVGDWLVDPDHWRQLRRRLAEMVDGHLRTHPLDHGVPVEAARAALDLPHAALVRALVEPPLVATGSRIVRAGTTGSLPVDVQRAVDAVRADLAAQPFAAPEADRLRQLGLGPRELAAAERAGLLLRVADAVALLPDAAARAAEALAVLPAPFTVSQARQVLATTRRVAVPLLELLDRERLTTRLPDGSRRLNRDVP